MWQKVIGSWPAFEGQTISDDFVREVERQINDAVEESGGGWNFDLPLSDPTRIGLVVATPSFPGINNAPRTYSISLRHLLTNTLSPSGWKNAVPLLTAGALLPVAGWAAYLAAATTLLSETVRYEDACILHKAWQIARFDGTFRTADLVAVADEIKAEYTLVKVAESDIEASLNALSRLGALSSTPSGYRLEEKVAFNPRA